MKRKLYVGLFVFLGFLIQQFVHGALEISYSLLLWRDYAAWSFGLSYAEWWQVHHVMSAILLFLGILLGYRSGKFWWNYLYLPDGTLKPEFKRKWRI
jgi:hypothetical protein